MEDKEIESKKDRNKKYIDRIIFYFLLIGIVGGLLELIFASLMVQSYHWGGISPSGDIWSTWGVILYPNFFIHRQIAIFLLLMAVILYPIWMWRSVNHTNKPTVKRSSNNLILGLFLPSFFIYGNPGGFYYGIAPTEFELTGVVTPIYNFIFTGVSSIDSGVTLSGLFPHQFALLGVYMFLFGLVQIKSLRFLEQGRIGIRLFLLLIIVNLVFVLLLFGNAMPSSFLPSNLVSYSYTLAKLSIPTPMFTIGILIQARSIQKMKSDQGL